MPAARVASSLHALCAHLHLHPSSDSVLERWQCARVLYIWLCSHGCVCCNLNNRDLDPQSRGFSHITSRQVTEPFDVAFNFLGDPGMVDERNGVAIYKLLFQIFQSLRARNPRADLRLLFPPDERIFQNNDDPDIAHFLRLGISITDHFASTNRMDEDPRRGVVDGQLRVHGTSNVFVADSSIMPTITDANNADTCFVIGWRMAEILVQEFGAGTGAGAAAKPGWKFEF